MGINIATLAALFLSPPSLPPPKTALFRPAISRFMGATRRETRTRGFSHNVVIAPRIGLTIQPRSIDLSLSFAQAFRSFFRSVLARSFGVCIISIFLRFNCSARLAKRARRTACGKIYGWKTNDPLDFSLSRNWNRVEVQLMDLCGARDRVCMLRLLRKRARHFEPD